MNIKKVIQKIIYPNTFSSERYIEFLRQQGAKIGDNCYIYAPTKTTIDSSRAFLLTIGNNVSITQGAIILVHDYSYSVLNDVYNVMPNPCSETKIGNNCFIGMNAIILSGAEIGDNCIIGAGSVVAGEIPNNSVAAGVPAKVICTLEQYYNKTTGNFDESAKLYVRKFKERKNRYPTIKEMGVYIALFLPRTKENYIYFEKINTRMINAGKNLFETKPLYSSYEDFLNKL